MVAARGFVAAAPDLYEAIKLRHAYAALPADRGGANGPNFLLQRRRSSTDPNFQPTLFRVAVEEDCAQQCGQGVGIKQLRRLQPGIYRVSWYALNVRDHAVEDDPNATAMAVPSSARSVAPAARATKPASPASGARARWRVGAIRVTIHKQHAPIAATFDDVGVSIFRKRNG